MWFFNRRTFLFLFLSTIVALIALFLQHPREKHPELGKSTVRYFLIILTTVKENFHSSKNASSYEASNMKRISLPQKVATFCKLFALLIHTFPLLVEQSWNQFYFNMAFKGHPPLGSVQPLDSWGQMVPIGRTWYTGEIQTQLAIQLVLFWPLQAMMCGLETLGKRFGYLDLTKT